MSIELNKESVEQADASSCQGTNCGTTTGDHSSECLAEAAAGQGWELKPGDLCGRDCPIHKISVEQAGGDERAAFEAWMTWLMDHVYGRLPDFTLDDGSGAHYVNADVSYAWTAWQARAALAQPSPAQAEAERLEVVARVVHSNPVVLGQCGPLNANDELMTVAQHAASVAHWAEMFNRVEQERDAALARVAELERQEPVALANRGLHAFWVKWTEAAAGLYGPGIKLYAAPVAQAQHSVPEGWKLVPIEPLLNMMSDKDHDTRITAERQLLSILADVPGNLVPQAWLDVQAERRRQITAEGWTPEHDDLYCAAELPRAAAAYILNGANDEAPAIWPFVAKWWKPRDARSNYVRAGALILAEIERLDRARQGGRS